MCVQLIIQIIKKKWVERVKYEMKIKILFANGSFLHIFKVNKKKNKSN